MTGLWIRCLECNNLCNMSWCDSKLVCHCGHVIVEGYLQEEGDIDMIGERILQNNKVAEYYAEKIGQINYYLTRFITSRFNSELTKVKMVLDDMKEYKFQNDKRNKKD